MGDSEVRKPGANESAFKFIMPVLVMMAVQVMAQLFAGQLVFFYKGYTYTEGSYEEFIKSYQDSLISNTFTMAVTIFSTFILFIIFFVWYRSEIVHAANMSLRKKCRVRGVLSPLIVPGVILISVGAGVFSSYVSYFVTMIRPDMADFGSGVLPLIGTSDSTFINVLLIAYFVILSPMCQELVFRGLTLGFAERRMSFIAANIIQALLFGALSMNLTEGIYYFLFGIVLGYIYYKTENILIPIVCNMLFCVTRLLVRDVNVLESSIVVFFIIFFLSMAVCYAGVLLVKKSKIKKEAKDDNIIQ